MRMDTHIDLMHSSAMTMDEENEEYRHVGGNGGFVTLLTGKNAVTVESQSRILGDVSLTSKCSTTTSSLLYPATPTPASTATSTLKSDYQKHHHILDQDDSDTVNALHAEDLSISSPKSSQSSTRNSPFLDDSQRLHQVHFDEDVITSTPHVDDRRLRRQIANCNERRRMQSINAGFQSLRQFLPQKSGEKMSKAAILQQTAELIHSLKLEKERMNGSLAPPNDPSIGAKTPPKKRRIEVEEDRREDMGAYLKTIDELRNALSREQHLRALYEQELVEMRKKNNALMTKSLTLDSSLAHLGDLLMKQEVNINSPIQRLERKTEVKTSLSTLSPTPEFPGVPHSVNSNMNKSSILPPTARTVYGNALLSAAAAQQQSILASHQLGTGHQSAFVPPVNVLNMLSSQTRLQNSLSNATALNLSFNLSNNTAVCQHQHHAATTTTVPTPDSVQTSGFATLQNPSDSGARNLNALFEAIRQLENANFLTGMNNNSPVQQHLSSANFSGVPSTQSSQNTPNSNSGTDLLVR